MRPFRNTDSSASFTADCFLVWDMQEMVEVLSHINTNEMVQNGIENCSLISNVLSHKVKENKVEKKP
jgi:hypothetical protein